ncbi:unnamed protein product (macronuclear) [Paramecium tetraurelia]|uniref:C3H1-type domain-containing protein n=1 Tax=Paramecium tetraurelia TaxID=5888 RepID=A0BE61_PARTE|nr:uncharacterized protein GSPATT00027860001 [Paramecium tetraurelia]CAK56828.1 unnamed protein product [Paramecium tetraurelia]|eukprot:XP_001424226.1 hypothetical protein (macronuclear) [Paramecium tetraurelia strain d4-2]
MHKQYNFAGVDLLQEFPEQQSYFEQTQGYQNDFESSRQPVIPEVYQPTNLGKDLFITLQNEYRNTRKVTTYSDKALFDLWKVTARSQAGKPPPKKPGKEPENEIIRKQLEHKRNLHFYAQANEKDVQYTLKQFGEAEEQNANISKFIEERQSQLLQQKKNQEKKNKKMSKEVLNRLFPKPLIQQEDDLKTKEKKQREQFVEAVIQHYKAKNPDHKNFRYPDRLRQYWSEIQNNKPQGKGEDFDLYFQDSMEMINDQFYKFKGFYTDNVDDIIKIWKQTLQNSKQEIVTYESEENLKTLMTQYLQMKKDQEDVNLGLRKIEMEKSMKKKKTEINFQRVTEIAKPKDRLKVGKTLLDLKKMYPNDKILRKMLLQEFRDTKVAKYPLEYDVVDSDEENKQKMRHLSQKGGCVITLEEMEVPTKMKIEEIADLFEKHMEQYYSEKQTALRKEEQERKKKRQSEFKLNKYIEQMAKKYLELRKKRFEEKVPTINEYLSTMYKQMLISHKEATKENFPHLKYGESKKLRKKSFPSSLKRYFFGMMKSYVRRKYDYIKDETNRIGFWVPTNGKSMCVVHKDSLCPPGCTRQTLNQRVIGQSRLVKEAQLFADRPKTSVWDSDNYQSERCNIMMTFSDAKECTFQPAVCYRMPEKLKRVILQTHNWAQNNVGKSGSLKHFLSQFGDNFKKVPSIYRFGIFKRSQVLYRKGDYRKSYQLLALSFNIRDLKLIFRDPEVKMKQPKPHPIFNAQNMGLDEDELKKVPHENLQLMEPEYQNKPEYKFLLEVYLFIKQMESYEDSLYQSQNNLKKMLKQDSRFYTSLQALSKSQSYDLRKLTVKDQMCPLGQDCPSIQTRWPNSNVSGVTPIGAECMFAHHPYELRFRQELRARKTALRGTLKAVTERLGGNLAIKAWNPAGNTMKLCIGCSEKALCSECAMKKKNIASLEILRRKAKKAYLKIKERPKFKERRKMEEKEAKNYNIKLSCLSRANALYNKERFSEAFEVIIKAIEIVKQEIEEQEKEFEVSQMNLKKQLQIDPDTDVTIKQVYESTVKMNPDDKQEAQKLNMYAKQTHLDADPEPDTRQFINRQIELLYKKIEAKLQDNLNDIQLMKQKINKIEDKDDQKAKSKTKDMSMKMCPEFIKEGRCKKGQKDCPYSHNYLLLDLEPTDSKLKSLQESIKMKEVSLRESKPPIPWVQSGMKDAEEYNNTAAYDKQLERKRILRSKSKQSKPSKSQSKDLYSQDFEDIKTPVYERKKKQNF